MPCTYSEVACDRAGERLAEGVGGCKKPLHRLRRECDRWRKNAFIEEDMSDIRNEDQNIRNGLELAPMSMSPQKARPGTF